MKWAMTFALASFVLISAACNSHSTGAEPNREPARSAGDTDRDAAPQPGVAKAEAENEDGEERETAEELAMRRNAFDSLARFRTTTCAAAIDRIEALLKRSPPRWAELDGKTSLPDDVLTALTQAELWWKEARQLCAVDAQRLQFDGLRTAMDALWRYPTAVSQAELHARLRAAGLEA